MENKNTSGAAGGQQDIADNRHYTMQAATAQPPRRPGDRQHLHKIVDVMNEEQQALLFQAQKAILKGESATATLPSTITPAVEGKVANRLVSAEKRRQQVIGTERGSLPFIPFLGQEGYIVAGWSHLIAGYPKAGKTELTYPQCVAWSDQKILFITEEPEDVWDDRLRATKTDVSHMTIFYALGVRRDEILKTIAENDATMVVIDTIRNLLGMENENDNSEVARVLTPFIALCRSRKKTLVFLHHTNKSGGEHGKGVTGGHAFLGVVDVYLEINFDQVETRRKLTGNARRFQVKELLYELNDNGVFVSLGSPKAVNFENAKDRVLDVLGENWMTVTEVRDELKSEDEGSATPSQNNIRNALNALLVEGAIERDPPDGGTGKTHRFRAKTTLPYMGGGIVEGKVTNNPVSAEGGHRSLFPDDDDAPQTRNHYAGGL